MFACTKSIFTNDKFATKLLLTKIPTVYKTEKNYNHKFSKFKEYYYQTTMILMTISQNYAKKLFH